jgi:predicted RNA-binding Zn ribbon-like protein
VLFAHDTEASLASLAALVNTVGPPEQLVGPADLDAFLTHWRWSGRRDGDRAELDAVRGLRPSLARLWDADQDQAADQVNGMLRRARAIPQLVRHDGWEYHVHATDPQAPLAERMTVEFAMAMVDVIRAGELGRLRRCEAQGCPGILVDLSRNRSRRFCDTACANRTNMAAFRARRRAGVSGVPAGEPPP